MGFLGFLFFLGRVRGWIWGREGMLVFFSGRSGSEVGVLCCLFLGWWAYGYIPPPQPASSGKGSWRNSILVKGLI